MDRKKAPLLWMLLATVVLLGRILPWALSDLSHDEIHTVCNFSGLLTGRGFWEIFRVYPYANNHFLCSALYWLWLKVIPGRTAPELLLRLPSLAIAILTLAAIVWGWRQHLGSRLAGLTALLFAASPVFGGFAFQIRGYVLAILLTAVAVPFLLDLLGESRHATRDTLALTLIAFLQPLVMASGVLFTPAIVLCLLETARRQKAPGLWLLKHGLPLAIGGLLAGLYYFTLGKQFSQAASQASANAAVLWGTPWRALMHTVLAFGLHLLPLLVLAVCLTSCVWRKSGAAPFSAWRQPLVIWLACLLTASALILAYRGHVTPFPRVFLLFLPLCTAAVALAVKNLSPAKTLPLWLILPILAFGLSVSVLADWQTARQLKRGIGTISLLQQHYRLCTANGQLAELCQPGNPLADYATQGALLVENNLLTEVVWSFLRHDLKPDNIHSPREVPQGFWPVMYPQKPLLVWALNSSRAKLLATYASGHEATPQFVMSIGHYQVYALTRQ